MNLLTPDDVAQQLSVPKTWVYKAVARGELPHLKLGRYVRFEPDAIAAYLRARSSC